MGGGGSRLFVCLFCFFLSFFLFVLLLLLGSVTLNSSVGFLNKSVR